tara:strand:+ start:10974 stop:11432 length:459 start_codon:yes stop_codon:yes gene_type:complete
MPAATTIALASLGVTAVGTISSISASRRAAQATQRQQGLQTRRSQRAAIRQAQLQRAQALTQAGALGVTGGSALGGGLSSLSSQLGSAQGFAGQMSGLSNIITTAGQQAKTGQAIASLGLSGFSTVGGFKALGINAGPTPPTANQLLTNVGQ